VPKPGPRKAVVRLGKLRSLDLAGTTLASWATLSAASRLQHLALVEVGGSYLEGLQQVVQQHPDLTHLKAAIASVLPSAADSSMFRMQTVGSGAFDVWELPALQQLRRLRRLQLDCRGKACWDLGLLVPCAAQALQPMTQLRWLELQLQVGAGVLCKTGRWMRMHACTGGSWM
jgi:hypothetical protein